MTKLVADLFRGLFAVITALLLLGSVAAGLRAYNASGDSVTAGLAAFLVAATLAVLLCGAIALQIENNRYLRRIADRLDQEARAGTRPPQASAPVDLVSGRVEPVLKR